MIASEFTKAKIEQGTKLFAARTGLLLHWQELSEHFYYERATFTASRLTGEDFAAGSMSSVAALARREMGDLFRAMLRPQNFVDIRVTDERLNKASTARAWLEWATKSFRGAMYRKGSQFVKSTVQTDHDWVTFGQGAIEVLPTMDREGIYYRNWHLRDVVWNEDYAGLVKDVHRQCDIELHVLVSLFPKTIPDKLRTDAKTDPFRKVKCRHIVCPVDGEDIGIPVREGHRFVSIWCIPSEGIELEKITRTYRGYVIPRAYLTDGTQYSRSPFTSIILPDARTKQTIERVLLEAGEKAIDPPMVATRDAVRSDVSLYAGGVTWVDMEYDERLGDALRPLSTDHSGLPFGDNMSARYDQIIAQGMMINKINLPSEMGTMTAYEVRKRIEEQMRSNIPMFEPVEVEYNEPLASESFDVLRSIGAFSPSDMPDELKGREIEFEFKSPIKDFESEAKGQMVMEGYQLLKASAEIDPSIMKLAKPDKITRDTLRSMDWPEEWLVSEDEFAESKQNAEMENQAMMAAQTLKQAGDAAQAVAPVIEGQAA